MDRLAPPVRRLLLAAAISTATLAAAVPGSAVRTTPDLAPHPPLGTTLGHDVGCVEPTQAIDTHVLAPRLTPIDAERRLLVGAGLTPAEVDAELGHAVAAWTQFLYLGDAQPRAAVASDLYQASKPRREIELVRDEYDGIWARHTGRIEELRQSGYTRDIWLLPAGTTFRGLLAE
jgi:hypothetical protein